MLVVNTSILILFSSLQVKQVQDWLLQWEKHHGNAAKGKKGNSSSQQKKAVLLSGNPGMGKTTTARLVCQLLGYEALEVLCLYFAEEQCLYCCQIFSKVFSESSSCNSLTDCNLRSFD